MQPPNLCPGQRHGANGSQLASAGGADASHSYLQQQDPAVHADVWFSARPLLHEVGESTVNDSMGTS